MKTAGITEFCLSIEKKNGKLRGVRSKCACLHPMAHNCDRLAGSLRKMTFGTDALNNLLQAPLTGNH